MTNQQRTIEIAPSDEPLALRLLSAVVLGWDRIPISMQGWILRDAFMMMNGEQLDRPESLMEFVYAHRD